VINNNAPVLTSFLKLIKYRLSAAVTFSAAAGFIIFSSELHWSRFAATIAGIYLLAGGSSALNQYQERERDGLMDRTANRPLPAGITRPAVALRIAIIMIITGSLTLTLLTGITPALLGLFNITLYNFVYTPLKRQSWLALLPGALVGAVPPLIGFTAAGGQVYASQALFLSLFMFMWQLPHFWLLQLTYKKDYERAGLASFISFPGEKMKKYTIIISILITSTTVMFAGRFGMEIGTGLYISLSVINIVLILSFIFLPPVSSTITKDTNRNTTLLRILNLYSFLVLGIMIIYSYGWLQP
jgi:protoheme IX farnesyltransferase